VCVQFGLLVRLFGWCIIMSRQDGRRGGRHDATIVRSIAIGPREPVVDLMLCPDSIEGVALGPDLAPRSAPLSSCCRLPTTHHMAAAAAR
jgi:hypothetical protein